MGGSVLMAKWEYCEMDDMPSKDLDFFERLVMKLLNIAGYYKIPVNLVAIAAGPQGNYLAAKSSDTLVLAFDRKGMSFFENKRKAGVACNALVQQLYEKGWEATGRGEKWYNYQFRREVTS
jgi:hypothetical protein